MTKQHRCYSVSTLHKFLDITYFLDKHEPCQFFLLAAFAVLNAQPRSHFQLFAHDLNLPCAKIVHANLVHAQF